MESDDKPRPTRDAEENKNNENKVADKGKDAKKEKKKKSVNIGWVLRIAVITFIISFSLAYLSESALADVHILPAAIVLALFIIVNCAFDLVGTSVTAADVRTFNSMAAKKVPGAKASIYLISKAATVSNFCNDVIGDICGVISGTMCAALSSEISKALDMNLLLTTLIVTALTASLTVGFKAAGKSLAMLYSDKVIYTVARAICLVIPERFFDGNKKK